MNAILQEKIKNDCRGLHFAFGGSQEVEWRSNRNQGPIVNGGNQDLDSVWGFETTKNYCFDMPTWIGKKY